MYRAALVLVLAAAVCEDQGDDGTASTAASMTVTASMTAGGSSGPDGSTQASESGEGDPSGGTTAESAGSTGPPPPGSCVEDAECRLHGDCCTCEALQIDEVPAACDQACDRDKCDDWGITEILCSHTCLVRLVECDASLVDCADAPPPCDAGFVPSVEARCWTRHCVPAELCVPT